MKRILIITVLLHFILNITAQRNSYNGFIFSDFQKAKIKYKDGTKGDAILNYDGITQQMVFINGDAVLAIADPGLIDTILIDKRKFVPIQKDVFYEVIELGNGTPLYINRKSQLVSVGKQGAYGTFSQTTAVTSYSSLSSDASGRYNNLRINEKVEEKVADQYFLKTADQFESLSSLKKLISLYPEKKNEIKKYAKDNFIKMDRESDIVMILNFCEVE